MTLNWREHSEALEEYHAAAQWYETQRVGLGDTFMDAVDAALNSILNPSIRWGFYRNRRTNPQVYSKHVSGFPYNIIYLCIEREVYVIAYAHERRQPRYWEHRSSN